MIKASELRIGNYLSYGAHGQVVVTEIKLSGKVRIGHTEQHSIDSGYKSSLVFDSYLDPIPLTDHIMQSCGFEIGEVLTDDGDEHSFWIIRKPNGNQLYVERDFQPSDAGFPITDCKIEYLHQLQNLYFALTGEELKINL